MENKNVKIVVYLKNNLQKFIKNPKLSLNHIYDMGDNYLFSVKSKEEKDLMDPYYLVNKKTLKISEFAFQNNIKEFNNALKNKVY